MVDMTVEGRIKREKMRLRRQFKDVGKDTLTTVDRLVDRVAFLTVTLEDLETVINEQGCTSEYKNGEHQWGMKKSPEVEAHATMMQRYLSAMKQLLDLRPPTPEPPDHDPVRAFVERR
jgi:hypothetical protein